MFMPIMLFIYVYTDIYTLNLQYSCFPLPSYLGWFLQSSVQASRIALILEHLTKQPQTLPDYHPFSFVKIILSTP